MQIQKVYAFSRKIKRYSIDVPVGQIIDGDAIVYRRVACLERRKLLISTRNDLNDLKTCFTYVFSFYA